MRGWVSRREAIVRKHASEVCNHVDFSGFRINNDMDKYINSVVGQMSCTWWHLDKVNKHRSIS